MLHVKNYGYNCRHPQYVRVLRSMWCWDEQHGAIDLLRFAVARSASCCDNSADGCEAAKCVVIAVSVTGIFTSLHTSGHGNQSTLTSNPSLSLSRREQTLTVLKNISTTADISFSKVHPDAS